MGAADRGLSRTGLGISELMRAVDKGLSGTGLGIS